MIAAVTDFIRANPVLTALIVFIVLVLDTLYIYRTLKRHWKRRRTAPQPGSSNSRSSGPA